jgi:hypothetical protein
MVNGLVVGVAAAATTHQQYISKKTEEEEEEDTASQQPLHTNGQRLHTMGHAHPQLAA